MITYPNMTSAYQSILDRILLTGNEQSPRGMKTKELTGFTFRLEDSRRNIVISPNRNISHKYLIAEWLWIWYGRNDVNTILPFNKNLAPFSDDDFQFSGAYGPQLIEQWSYVYRTILKDPDTRQAIITLWRPRPGESKDIPCTIALQFLRRNNKLNLITTMRSNDAWLGLPYDVFTFTQLQMQMANQIGISCGWYQHQAGSMHLYERDFAKATRVIDESSTYSLEDYRILDELGYSKPVSVPQSVEPFFLSLSQHLQANKDFPFYDDPMKLAAILTGDVELQSYLCALAGFMQGRLQKIREFEHAHG